MPEDGIIHIILPPELTIFPAILRSGGSCTQNDDFVCTDVIMNERTVVIQSKKKIEADSVTTINITGVQNPRSAAPSGEIVVVTFDIDGISEIDRGFNIVVQMKELWAVDNFSVQPTSIYNGAINSYKFTLSSRVRLRDGDIVQFDFPEETRLPAAEQLIIEATPRNVNGKSVFDNLTIEKTGESSVKITFVNVAPTTETYNWQI